MHLTLLAFIFTATGAAYWHNSVVKSRLTVAKVQYAVKHSVHMGDSPPKVMNWLNAQRWDSSYLDQKKGDLGVSLAIDTDLHHSRDLSGVIISSTPEVENLLGGSSHIQLVFYFDKRKKLVDYSVDEASTSL